MLSTSGRNSQRTTSHIAAYRGGSRAYGARVRRSSAGVLTNFADLPAKRNGGGSYIPHHSGNFDPELNGSEATEQPKVAGDAVCGMGDRALKKHNPTRDKSKHIIKILRLQPKNIEKKDLLFWPNDPDKLLKTNNIKNLLRKTNPSEPDKSLKTNNIRNN